LAVHLYPMGVSPIGWGGKIREQEGENGFKNTAWGGFD